MREQCTCQIPRVNNLFDDYHLILSVKDVLKRLTSYPVCLCIDMDVCSLRVKCYVLSTEQQPNQQCAVQAITNNVV